LQRLEERLGEQLAAGHDVGPLHVRTDDLRTALVGEARAWTLAYARRLNATCAGDMDALARFIDDLRKRLSRPVDDLDDIRAHMAALSELRDAEVRVDLTLAPIEDAYALLARHGLTFNDGNAERVDSLCYAWRLLQQQVSDDDVCLVHCKNIRLSTEDIRWRVFYVLTEPVPCTSIFINQRNDEARVYVAVSARSLQYSVSVYGNKRIRNWFR